MLPNLPVTPLHRVESVAGFRRLFVKDESGMPNGTFKDRLSREALRRYPQATTFAALSYGNTAVSLARTLRTARTAGLTQAEVVLFLPRGYEGWELGPSSHGTVLRTSLILEELSNCSTVLEVDVRTSILEDEDLLALAGAAGVRTEAFVNITEGLDVPAYASVIMEAVAQLGSYPDICIVPYGAGILCNEIHDYLRSFSDCKVVPLSVALPTSPARMLYGPAWLDVERLFRDGVALSRHRSPDRTGATREPYQVFAVTDDEILRGVEFARREGLSAEPSGAVGFGVLARLDKLVSGLSPERDVILIINTGNGIDGFLGGKNE